MEKSTETLVDATKVLLNVMLLTVKVAAVNAGVA